MTYRRSAVEIKNLDPEAARLCRVGAAMRQISLTQWITEAIFEKAEKEGIDKK